MPAHMWLDRFGQDRVFAVDDLLDEGLNRLVIEIVGRQSQIKQLRVLDVVVVVFLLHSRVRNVLQFDRECKGLGRVLYLECEVADGERLG